MPAEEEEVVKPSAVSGGKGDLGTAVSDVDGEPRMTLQALQSQVVGQAEAAKQRRRRRMQQLRKGDSALALGLFENFFNLEVHPYTFNSRLSFFFSLYLPLKMSSTM